MMRLVILSAVTLVAAWSLVACGGTSGAKTPAGGPPGQDTGGGRIQVQGRTVSQGTLTATNVTAGTVVAVTTSNVAARTAGTVSTIHHRSGDHVAANDRVIQLDDSQFKLDLKTAQSNLESAQIDLTTAEDTTSQANPKLELRVSSAQAAVAAAQKKYDGRKAQLDLGGATATDVDTALSELKTAQADLQTAQTDLDQNRKAPTGNLAQYRIAIEKRENEVQQARLNLQHVSIVAPFAGQISAISVNPGEYVQAGTTVFTLVSIGREIHFNVPPAHASRLAIGSKLTFTFGGAGSTITVKEEPSAPVNGSVPMVATAPANAPSIGSVGTISYSVSLGAGVLIPLSALKTSTQDKNYVFVVENGTARQRSVSVRAESGVAAAVTGITSGSVVIENAPPGLLDGASVEVTSTDKEKDAEESK